MNKRNNKHPPKKTSNLYFCYNKRHTSLQKFQNPNWLYSYSTLNIYVFSTIYELSQWTPEMCKCHYIYLKKLFFITESLLTQIYNFMVQS